VNNGFQEPREMSCPPAAWRRMLAGGIAGVIGAALMNVADRGSYSGHGAQTRKDRETANEQHPARDPAENAVMMTANIAPAEPTLWHAATAAHYAFGTVCGTAYGLVTRAPTAYAARGLGYGLLIWALVDELALPLLNISKKPREYRPAVHMRSAALHGIYGLVLGFSYRALLPMESRQTAP
jgi:hypothetical protein